MVQGLLGSWEDIKDVQLQGNRTACLEALHPVHFFINYTNVRWTQALNVMKLSA